MVCNQGKGICLMTLIISKDPAAMEREACACVCDEIIRRYDNDIWTVAARACVIAIRARAVTHIYDNIIPHKPVFD